MLGVALKMSEATERAWQIFWYFLRTGAVLFGSSLVLFTIKEDVVNRFGWLTTQRSLTPSP